MTCIHGLDNINCPICRIEMSTSTSIQSKLDSHIKSPLDLVQNRALEQDNAKKVKLEKILGYTKGLHNFNSSPINLLTPNLSSSPPDFKNKLFLQRIKEIDFSNSDKLGLPKKIKLANSDLQIE